MRNATKVVLESIQVSRHLVQLGIRPLDRLASKGAKAAEELGLWALKLPPVEEALGRQRKQQILDGYYQAKDLVGKSLASVSHQSWMSALQSGAKGATTLLHKAGFQTRVVGPFDAHWNTLKVLKDLRSAAGQAAARGKGPATLQLTPKRFVQFMREGERMKQKVLQRDPVEDYVDWMLANGSLRSLGPVFFEKKLYRDVVRIICFAFDRALTEVNGATIWGHVLRVKALREFSEHLAKVPRQPTAVGIQQVEAFVDRMLKSKDLEAPPILDGVQRQLLVNCSLMILQLLEDLSSERHLQVFILGHSLHLRLEQLPMERVLQEVAEMENLEQRFSVNDQAINELVDALLEEPEVQAILVPDLVEAEVYRYALHRILCIAQFMLSQLQIRLFGTQVRLGLFADHSQAPGADKKAEDGLPLIAVREKEVQSVLARIEDEQLRIERELGLRRGDVHLRRSSLDGPALMTHVDLGETEDVHEFTTMAAQDRLSRSLAIQRNVSVPIEIAFQMVSDVNAYPQWMPFCTSAFVTSKEEAEGPGGSPRSAKLKCDVGFGLDTGTALGAVGDTIKYQVSLLPPTSDTAAITQVYHQEPGDVRRVARVVADTVDGFRYGRRLVYDWRFIEFARGHTDVRLDMFFQARNFFFLPIWDSMQASITSVMMREFQKRAVQLQRSRTSPPSGDRRHR